MSQYLAFNLLRQEPVLFGDLFSLSNLFLVLVLGGGAHLIFTRFGGNPSYDGFN